MYHLIGRRIEDLLLGEICRTIRVIHRKIIGLVTKDNQAIPHQTPVKPPLVELKPNQEIDFTHRKVQAAI